MLEPCLLQPCFQVAGISITTITRISTITSVRISIYTIAIGGAGLRVDVRGQEGPQQVRPVRQGEPGICIYIYIYV